MGAAAASDSGGSNPDGSPLGTEVPSERRLSRRGAFVGVAVVALLLAVAVGYVVGSSRHQDEVGLADVVFCSVSTRPDDQQPPTLAGDLRIDWRTVDPVRDDGVAVEASGDGLTFSAGFGYPYPPEGHVLGLTVLNGRGRLLHNTTYQFWEGPVDFDASGFTGLHYVYDADTGAELQYSCSTSRDRPWSTPDDNPDTTTQP